MEAPAHSLGKVLRNLASHYQRKGEHEAVLEAIRRSARLLPAICERLKELGLPPTSDFQEDYLSAGAEIAIVSCFALGREEEGEEFLRGCLSLNRVQLRPEFGELAVRLALERLDFVAGSAEEVDLLRFQRAGSPGRL